MSQKTKTVGYLYPTVSKILMYFQLFIEDYAPTMTDLFPLAVPLGLTIPIPIISFTTQPSLSCLGSSAGNTSTSCLIGMTPTNSGSLAPYTVPGGTILLTRMSAPQI